MNINLNKLIEKSKKDFTKYSYKVRISECDEPYVALKESQRIRIRPIWVEQIDQYEGPLYEQYIADNPAYQSIYVRVSIARMLENTISHLPQNWALVVRAGHRPVGVQAALFKLVKKELFVKNPQLADEEVLGLTRTYVADPSLKSPAHCCGAAVDVDALSLDTGKMVDFGSQVNEDSEVSRLHSNLVSKSQNRNRLVLLEAMLKAGFAPLDAEWWHYSFGDQNWAVFYNKQNAKYNIKEPSLDEVNKKRHK